MKRILIAGEGSYIGTQLAAWLNRSPERFIARTLDTRGDGWQAFDFTGFDALVLVAGIAHLRETPENEPLYDAVNHRLAVAVAERLRSAVAADAFYVLPRVGSGAAGASARSARPRSAPRPTRPVNLSSRPGSG